MVRVVSGRPGLLKILRDVYFIAYLTNIFWFKRQPLDMVLITMFTGVPVVFITVFRGPTEVALIGAVISTPALIGLTSSAQGLSWDKFIKLKELLVASPVHPVSYALGNALGPLLATSPALLLYSTLLSNSLGGSTMVLYSLGLGLLTWLASVLIGYTIASTAVSPFRINTISLSLAVAFTFLAPVYYPASLLPPWLRLVALAPPTSLAAEAARGIAGVSGVVVNPGTALAALTLELLLAGLLLSKVSRWVEE